MAKKKKELPPTTSRRGKSAWVDKTIAGDKVMYSGSTSGGATRASMVSNSRRGALGSGQGERGKKTGKLTGGGF